MTLKKRSLRCKICGFLSTEISNAKGDFMVKFPLNETCCRQWVKAAGQEDYVIMNNDTNNPDQHASSRPVVTSVGNAWVVCDSKSRHGYKYYFNTLSGQSVWNLSPEDIEKAKKYTKDFPRSEIEKCPEPPTDPPMDPPFNSSQRPPKQYFNNQILQLPNQVPSLFPIMPILPNGFNPFIWNNPPNNVAQTQPIIYVPVPTPPITIQSQEPNNLYINKYEINENDSTSSRNNGDVNSGNRSNNNGRFTTFNNDRYNCRNTGHRSFLNSGDMIDLRQKLRRKRSISVSSGSNLANRIEETNDVDYKKNVIFQNQFEEETSKYDLSVLDELKPANSKITNWFIVVDTEILLENFNFLNKLSNPDQNCYLYIPDHVMSELIRLVSSSSDRPTRRILRFLTEQIQCEFAFKGNEVSDDIDDIHKLFNTCKNVASQNNVVLLSNDTRLERFKHFHNNIHIFTLNELKKLLNEEHRTLPTRIKSPTLDIKIVVTNDSPSRSKANTSDLSKLPDNITQLTPKKTGINDQQSIQTPALKLDNSDLNSGPKENNTPPKVRAKISFEKQSEEIEKRSLGSLNKNEGRNEIKLFRNPQVKDTENRPNTSQNKYRWRRQKSNTSTISASKSTCSDQAAISEPSKQHETTNLGSGNQMPKTNPIVPSITTNPPKRDPSLDRSSLSSNQKQNERQNIIIEETSTSGEISNTTLGSESFNCDKQPKADSSIIHNPNKVQETIKLCDDVEFVKFEVVGHSMVEFLKIRREEWVLRFVQIMEETLREMLRKDTTFQSKDNCTPQWLTDLPELSRCVIKKFSDDFNVVDAANRLCFTLKKISDNKGKISPDIQPEQYMDLYSIGVYLVEALKRVLKNCEDLVTAEESLKQLLFDIQNANHDSNPIDSFPDEMNDSVLKTTEQKDTEEEQTHDKRNCEEDRYERNSNENQSFLPHLQNPAQGSQEQQERQLTCIETRFFSSLALAKTSSTEMANYKQNSPQSTPNSARIEITSPQAASSPKTPQTPPLNLPKINPTIQESAVDNLKKVNDNDSVNSAKDNEKTSAPVIIRNFASIPQFEEKLKKRLNFTNDPEAIDDEFVEDDFDYEHYDDEYFDEDYEYGGDNELEKGAKEELEEGEIFEKDITNFEYYMKELTDEIRQSLRLVEYFCKQLIEELKKSNKLSSEMQDKLKFVSALITKAKTQINSIFKRDSTMSGGNLVNLLKKARLDNYVPDDEDFSEYKNTIKEFQDNLNGWCHIVSQIMESTNMQVE